MSHCWVNCLYWHYELLQKVKTCTCQNWIMIRMNKNTAFTTVCMLQMCGKFIGRQLSRLQIIKFSWNLSASISVFGASLQQCTQYICWRHFLIKASGKSNGSSIWNNKNTDKNVHTYTWFIRRTRTFWLWTKTFCLGLRLLMMMIKFIIVS